MPLYVGDIGNVLRCTFVQKVDGATSAVDLTGAAVFLLLEKPTGEVVQVTASITNHRRGLAQYITVADDIDTDGTWNWQARIEFEDGSVWHGPKHSFEVHEHLDVTA